VAIDAVHPEIAGMKFMAVSDRLHRTISCIDNIRKGEIADHTAPGDCHE
jgi:hypothetical protein